ncbi:MAG: class I SAM-dependent methyltransferase [Actinomycetota bacterium]|nr:class I SAM-dependent methyltransferase [Actinomycetota bacterium]
MRIVGRAAIVDGLPPTVQQVLRAVRRSVTGARAPAAASAGEVVLRQPYDGPIPADLADADPVRTDLADTDVFGPAEAEAHGYLADAFDRFRITMALLDDVPRDAEVLELGANPYFLTRLLERRGLRVTCANWFGQTSGFGHHGSQVVRRARGGGPQTYEFDHFNVETERFPYADDRFDVALFCEILEHLPNDPIHTLCELHRVLRPGGTLVLTTPNATRRENLVRMVRGDNVYEQLSGYGTYGRHNREYTVSELRTLLESCGWDVVRVFAADLHDRSDLTLPAAVADAVAPQDRGDNLFAVAHPRPGAPSWRYPEWLYSSVHALRRLVAPELVVGRSCDLQSSGLHALEDMKGSPSRWMGAAEQVTAMVAAPPASLTGPVELVVEGVGAPPAAGSPIELRVRVGDEEVTFKVDSTFEAFTVTAPVALPPGTSPGDEVEVVLTTDRTWVPADVGMGADHRRLSLALRRVAVVDVS